MATESFIRGLLTDTGWRVQASAIVALRERDPDHTIVTFRRSRRGNMWSRSHPDRDATNLYLDHPRRVIVMHPQRIDELGLSDLLEGVE